jgi:hypothetical protein
LLRKLGVSTSAELLVRAIRHELAE